MAIQTIDINNAAQDSGFLNILIYKLPIPYRSKLNLNKITRINIQKQSTMFFIYCQNAGVADWLSLSTISWNPNSYTAKILIGGNHLTIKYVVGEDSNDIYIRLESVWADLYAVFGTVNYTQSVDDFPEDAIALQVT